MTTTSKRRLKEQKPEPPYFKELDKRRVLLKEQLKSFFMEVQPEQHLFWLRYTYTKNYNYNLQLFIFDTLPVLLHAQKAASNLTDFYKSALIYREKENIKNLTPLLNKKFIIRIDLDFLKNNSIRKTDFSNFDDYWSAVYKTELDYKLYLKKHQHFWLEDLKDYKVRTEKNEYTEHLSANIIGFDDKPELYTKLYYTYLIKDGDGTYTSNLTQHNHYNALSTELRLTKNTLLTQHLRDKKLNTILND